MTRFARAKGSKSSNERVPNEATPWHVMKEQLQDNATMKNDQIPKAKSAKELLSEKDDLYYYDSTGNVNNEWAKFETSGVKKMSTEKQRKKMSKIKPMEKSNENKNISESETLEAKTTKKHEKNGKLEVWPKSEKNKTMYESLTIENGSPDARTVVTKDNTIEPQKSSNKRKSNVPIDIVVTEDTKKLDEAETKPKKKKKKKNKRSDKEVENSSEVESSKISESSKSEVEKDEKSAVKNENGEGEKFEGKATTGKISKRHKRNQKRISKNAMEKAAADAAASGKKSQIAISGGFDAAGNDWSSNVNFGKRGKIDESKDSASQDQLSAGKNLKNRPDNSQENIGIKRKAPKIRDDKEHKRRKPDIGSIKCIINGFEVEIVKYDGFPVKKEDAERLKELRKQMIMKGIPKSEINVAMKLERRKAEKALARVKKQVCFHCRKAGHNLSDCPELGDEESATGICFKCGSTEHTHFECKVTKKEEFRFASCFICREQGHIAKQCPDNPKGLYPQGGACKICGDVTHLRKDCPDLTREKEETTVTLGTIAENTIESLDDDSIGLVTKDESQKPKSKIVKF